jgi:hypothetical protein
MSRPARAALLAFAVASLSSARRAEIDPAAQNAACAACHADIAAEQRGSFHQRAFVDPAFQTALSAEPLAFCRGCHAPEADPARDPPPALAALGVACTSCHVERDAPHTATARVDCARCHEFDFPDAAKRPTPEKMQATASEHAASGRSETACAGCHMPMVGEGARRHRSHAFASTRDPQQIARALTVTAARRGERASLMIAAGEVGHAFPTGDLFRRLAVTAVVVGEDGALVAAPR